MPALQDLAAPLGEIKKKENCLREKSASRRKFKEVSD